MEEIASSDLLQHLMAACRDKSLPELQQLHGWVCEIIKERKLDESRRKGARVMDEMRGVMARSGVSMDEFQAALSGLPDPEE